MPPTNYHDRRGSLWHRWDLHFHTPASYDYQDKSVTEEQIVDGLIAQNIRVVAITDHHTIDIARIQKLQALGRDRLTVLPGIEFRGDQGEPPIHYIGIFPEDSDLQHIWTTLQGKHGLTPAGVAGKGGKERVYIPIEQGAKTIRYLGGIVSIHAGTKSNSIEKIRNNQEFQKQIKFDITKEWVDLMEIGQIKDIDVHLNTIFPSINIERPLVICSDCHNINQYAIKAPLWLRADPCFRGLKMVLREPRDRVYIGNRPPSIVRVEQNPTKYIKQITFDREPTTPKDALWFTGNIEFNSGLIAIIGNKGSGKSALADALGLLGATRNSKSFSFLNSDRFRHPLRGRAEHFHATLEWGTGIPARKCLDDDVIGGEVERIKYLPQYYVEAVCNELVDGSEGSFEKELKSVIFSHVPESQRLGQTTLDDLVRFQTEEKQRHIDSLIQQLRSVSRARSVIEAQASPTSKQEIAKQLESRKAELDAHNSLKPDEVKNPATSSSMQPADSTLLEKIGLLQQERSRLKTEIELAVAQIRDLELRRAIARRTLEKLSNFRKDFQVFMDSLTADARAIGLDPNSLVSLNIQSLSVTQIQEDAESEIQRVTSLLDNADPPGFRKQQVTNDETLSDLEIKLDMPNREYQNYLKELTAWQAKRDEIEGDENEADSLKGLEATLLAYEKLPERIQALKADQRKIALDIHQEKLAQAEVYSTLYGPVQNFIDAHDIAKNRLQLEFRAELDDENFVERFLSLLSLNRRGSFMGTDEGRERAENLVNATNWVEPDSIGEFLENIETSLHYDLRSSEKPTTHLKEQLRSERKPEEIFDLIYSLEYIRPKYILRWAGKDLSMLSPGERGTLLLVFYLLIDKGDTPLLIDQPEGNLDNHTVAKVLVDCIKEARDHRQIFIVTHNPNLAVVCDADQVIHAEMDIEGGNAITYTTGALENPAISQYVTDVLEGTRFAFNLRGNKYDVVG